MAAILCQGLNQACGGLPCCADHADEENQDGNNKNAIVTMDGSNQQRSVCKSWWKTLTSSIFCCGCGGYLSTLKHICTNPFGIFVTVTVVSNLPPMLIALTEVGNIYGDSSSNGSGSGSICPSSVWLLINFLFSWIHVIASFYIAFSINQRVHKKHYHSSHGKRTTTTTLSLEEYSAPDKTIYRRASNLFCYDPVMAIYIMTVCLYAVFLFVPRILHLDYPSISQQQNNNNNNNNSYRSYNNNQNSGSSSTSSCTIYVHEKVIASVGFAWAFLAFGLGALALSFGFAYVDATRQSRQAAAMMSKYDTSIGAASELEVSTMATYTSMEDNGADGADDGARKRDHNSDSSSSKKHNKKKCKNDNTKKRGSSGLVKTTRVILDDYVPPMITNASSTETPSDPVVEAMSSTEETANTQQRRQRERSRERGGDTTEVDTIGMATDYETSFDGRDGDDEEDDDDDMSAMEGLGSADASERKSVKSKGSKGSKLQMAILSYEDEDDAFPTSFEFPYSDTEGFTTDGGRQTDTDTRYTDGETDIERAIDLTDVDESVLARSKPSRFEGMTHVANLDLVLGESKDPSVSANFTDEDGTTDEYDDGNASQDGSSVGSRGSSVRSVLSMFKRRGRPNPGIDAPQSSAAPASIHQHKHDDNALAGVINLVSAGFDSDANNDDNKQGELCYSTSMGSAVGPPEPLSFVDGGSCNKETKLRIFTVPDSHVRGCDPPDS